MKLLNLLVVIRIKTNENIFKSDESLCYFHVTKEQQFFILTFLIAIRQGCEYATS